MTKLLKNMFSKPEVKRTKFWYKIHKHDKSGHRKHTVKYEDLCQ